MTSPDPIGKPKPSSANSAEFVGTDNPRHLRVLAVMLRRPISRQELDNAEAAARQAAASVATQKASVRTAQVNLDFTRIRAPISGRDSGPS